MRGQKCHEEKIDAGKDALSKPIFSKRPRVSFLLLYEKSDSRDEFFR